MKHIRTSAIIRGTDMDVEFMESNLSPSEVCEYMSVVYSKKHRWLLGRTAAKRAAEIYFCDHGMSNLLLKNIEILKKNNGAPFCRVRRGNALHDDLIHVSLSHSGNVAYAAVVESDSCVGVDIEKIRVFNDATVYGFLTPSEYKVYADVKDKNLFATVHWCLKEAYMKACGLGLVLHPQRIHVNNWNDNVQLCVDGRLVTSESRWTTEGDFYILTTVLL